MTLQCKNDDSKAMHWLVRYAKHCGLRFHGDLPVESQLRLQFGPPAWRIMCRSGRTPFVPILRNRDLTFADLVEYGRRLAKRSFVKAPRADLLAFFITQRRRYFDDSCRIPVGVDFELMRIAHKEISTRAGELALVANWLPDRGPLLAGKPRWKSLVRRSREAQRLELPTLQRSSGAWSFFCQEVVWRGHEIRPLRESTALWLEGAAMGSCLFKLRRLCSGLRPSRFFSVRQSGARLATLELCWMPPEESFTGMDAALGRWCLLDLRLSFNRLPDASLIESMTDFARVYTVWSHRPGRWPFDHPLIMHKNDELAEGPPNAASTRQRIRSALAYAPYAPSGVPAALVAASPDLPVATCPRPA